MSTTYGADLLRPVIEQQALQYRLALDGIRGDGARSGWRDGTAFVMVGGAGGSDQPARSLSHHDCTGSGQPFGADRRRQMLRPGAPASLAGRGALSRLWWDQRGPGRM